MSILLSGTNSGFAIVEVNEGVTVLSALLTEITANGDVDNGSKLGEQIVQELFMNHFLGIMSDKVNVYAEIFTGLVDGIRLRWATQSENTAHTRMVG